MKLSSRKAVAFQGEHGAFSEMAVFDLFGKQTKAEPSTAFHDVFEKVKSGKCDYGVVPVENSLGGIVYQVWDCLNEYNLNIIAEAKVKIEHCLIVNPGTKLTDIYKIYTHYQAALQCDKFLKQHPNWRMENAYDTAGSVKIIKNLIGSEKLQAAAIASERAAKIYGMQVLKEGIQDSNDNYTRFIVLSRKKNTNGNKISLACSLKHKPGTLLAILEIVKKHGINLTSIHSRPNKTKKYKDHFHYHFFLEGTFTKPLDKFFPEICRKCKTFKLLGIYRSNL